MVMKPTSPYSQSQMDTIEKKNYKHISLMNTGAKIFNKMLPTESSDKSDRSFTRPREIYP